MTRQPKNIRSTHRLREKSGLTTQEAMEVLRVSRSTLARYCKDEVLPRPARITERHKLYHTESVFALLEDQWSDHVAAPNA